MKFFHISDLHLGKHLHHYPLQEEQDEILERIRAAAAQHRPDAILIAGDVYDRNVPPVYATQSLDAFLNGLTALGIPVLMISGNHDSADRLGFLAGPLRQSGLYISPAYRGDVKPVTLEDEWGPVDFWLLPFVKPNTVRPYFPDEEIATTNDAVACAIRHMAIDERRRNVLIAHQFVTGGVAAGSEEGLELMTGEVSVGGTDLVDVRLFAPFDYTALGHLHGAQRVGSDRVRYSGTPLKYSFAEVRDRKSITVGELNGERELTITLLPLVQPRELQEIRGEFDEIMSPERIMLTDRDAYTRVILTDDLPIPGVMDKLRQVYPNLARLDWDNTRTRHTDDFALAPDMQKHSPLTLFNEFFFRTNGKNMSEEQSAYLDEMIRSIWEDEV